MWIEVIGYVGMTLILCSFLMKKAYQIRIVNICGAVLSLSYGILTRTWPTALLNASLMVVNIIYLIIHFYNCRKKSNL